MSVLQELRRRWWLIALAVVVLLLLFAAQVATFYTDVLWFDSIGFVNVFWTLLGTRVGIGVLAALIVGALIAGNLLLAKRLAPPYRMPSPQEETIERYRELVEPFARPLLLAVAVLVGVLSGASMASEWDTVLLYLNRVPFPVDDPQFGRNVGYFVFELPFYTLINSWLFTTLALTIVLVAVSHYLFGGIRPQSPGQKLSPQVNVHLSVLLAALVAVRAWGFVLDQHMLSFSERGTVTGLSYTDINAQLLAYQLLAIIAGACVLLFLANIRFRTWLLPVGGVGILVIAGVVLAGIYPAVIQRLQVDPQELPREREYIARNLEMTRFAFGIDNVVSESFPANSELSAAQVADNRPTLQSIRLWDPATLQNTYQQLQEFRPYYDFRDVDVDRYRITAEQTEERLQQVMISVREISERDLSAASQTWQNERLFYTHGFGLVASDVSIARPDGQPVFLVNDIPPRGVEELAVDNPRIYFGENPPEYSIIDTDQPELDYPTEEGPPELYSYTGEDGVEVGSPLRRLAFALRYQEPNFVLSSLINPESRILFNRSIRARVEAVAPFLQFDHDPYPVAVDGRIVWIQDAYTSTDMIPYSERVELSNLTVAEQRQLVTVQDPQTGEIIVREQTVPLAGLDGPANYIRNSVKAVIDAYDGTVTLYVIDEDDPIIQAWSNVFPESFTSGEEASDNLRAHFRYPEDMFRVQAELYRTYHIPGPDEFYTREDAWDLPVDAAAIQNQQGDNQGNERSMRPYYLLMRLPGEPDEEFMLIQPYNPIERPNLIAWLAARSDGEDYGELKAYLMPPDETVYGPQQIQARVDQEQEISQQIALWNQSGSRVIYGNLLVIPVEDSLLYAQPLFLRAEQSDIPQLTKVVLILGDRVVFENSLSEGLTALFGAAAPTIEVVEGAPDQDVEVGSPGDAPDPGEVDGPVDPQVVTLIREALQAFADAEEALVEGDLGTYRERTQDAEAMLEQAQGLIAADVPDDPGDDGTGDDGTGADGTGDDGTGDEGTDTDT